jgi:hypothetical protein
MTGTYRTLLEHKGYNWNIKNVTEAYRISLEHTGYKWRMQNITGAYRMWLEHENMIAAYRITIHLIPIRELH